MSLLFVYGSLKEGFPNFHVNRGRRLPGEFRTVQLYPLFLANGRLPCLLPTPGQGHRVLGQVFEVAPSELAEMDALERVGKPGGYSRLEIEVAPDSTHESSAIRAFAYFQDPVLLEHPGEHIGPLAEYTPEHAKRLSW